MKYGYIKAVTAVALFVCYMLALLTIQDHVLFYQEQHSLFLWSGDYFRNTVHSSGLLYYIGAFLIQFYHIPWLGAAIVSILAVAVYLLTESIITKVTGWRDLLQLGVAAAVGLYFTLDGIDDTPAWLMFAVIALGVVRGVLCFVKGRKADKTKLTVAKIIIPVVLAAVYFIVGLQIEMRDYDRRERAMVRAERAIKQKDWDGALRITEQYLSTGNANRLMLYLRNIALAQKGELIDRMFDFPQKIGQQALAFSWNHDSRDAEYGHWVHEITGDVNAAHQWAFEAMTAMGETAPHLSDLAQYNVALGRPKVAEKFAKQLDKTLFYRDIAKSIRRQIAGEEEVPVVYAVPDSIEIKWINVLDFRPNVMQNSRADSTNTIARQYLIASLLVNGNLDMLIPMLTKEDMKHRIIQEAVLIYSLDPQATPLEEFGLKLDESVTRDFSPYYSDLRSGFTAPDSEERWRRTYWYYLHAVKPKK
ncbi:MAG: hypothetical protein K2M11_01845 [Paramuribaculum sp.]|nr:hypothetical protein [Paramuribaculum sp.]